MHAGAIILNFSVCNESKLIIIMSGWSQVEAAVQWLMEHADDDGIDAPLEDEPTAARGAHEGGAASIVVGHAGGHATHVHDGGGQGDDGRIEEALRHARRVGGGGRGGGLGELLRRGGGGGRGGGLEELLREARRGGGADEEALRQAHLRSAAGRYLRRDGGGHDGGGLGHYGGHGRRRRPQKTVASVRQEYADEIVPAGGAPRATKTHLTYN